MILKLINHKEEYAVREITASFFPKTKFEYTDDLSGDYVLSEYRYENGRHIYYSKASIGGVCKDCELKSGSYNKTYIKKSIAVLLEDITKIHLPWGALTGIRPAKIAREMRSKNYDAKKIEDKMTSFYNTDRDKARLAIEVEKNEACHIASMPKESISLYIGIPFCPTRCLYCSFTSQSIDFSNKLTEPYADALIKEIRAVSQMEYVRERTIDTVYFGGGTPTALNDAQIDKILCELFKQFDLNSLRELTFEAGRPDTITRKKLEILKKHGISRISINPQTASDETLKLIGRKHSTEDFINSFKLAREMGFRHINCDIIAGLPNEDENDFKNTLELLKLLNPESITVHTMCIKHGSYLDMKYDMYSPTKAEIVNNMLSLAKNYTSSMEMKPYYMYRQKNMLGNLENVGYCKDGHECLYNIYIMEEVQSIIALGAGGSTKLVDGERIERAFNVKEVSEYINRIDEMIERKKKLTKSF